jgi:hypothetical protein
VNESLSEFDATREKHSTKRKLERLKSELKAREQELEEALGKLAILEAVASQNPMPPKWRIRDEAKKAPPTTVVAMLSDLHLDEVVDPGQTHGNAYNRVIATERIATWADRVAKLAEDGHGSLILLWGGDMVTGEIHPELARTNDGTGLIDTCVYWAEILSAAFNLISEHWGGRVEVYCTYGNHGRMDMKMQLKDYSHRNFDYLLAHMVSRTTDDIEWHIPLQIDCEFRLFDNAHILTHGNHGVGRGAGSGIGGLWPPIIRMVAKMREEYASLDMAIRHVWMGHWHTPTFGSGWTINGTPKGPDEYTRSLRLPPSPPAQVYEVWSPDGAESKHLLRV